MDYKEKFIEGISIKQIDEELKEMDESLYKYGRAIDLPRKFDLIYTKKILQKRENTLTSKQKQVLDFSRKLIDESREKDFVEWCGKNYNIIDKHIGYREKLEKEYKESKEGIVIVNCNSRTIKGLENKGFIKIIHDSKNDKGLGFDVIKVLNY